MGRDRRQTFASFAVFAALAATAGCSPFYQFSSRVSASPILAKHATNTVTVRTGKPTTAKAASSERAAATAKGATSVTGATTAKEQLVPYNGPVQHIFFHPLIAYPERAFDNDSMSKGYNDWDITVREFDKILPSLYQKHFILIDIRSMFAEKQVNGKTEIVKKQLMLPKGKKPLIISIDDMNYDPDMIRNGNVSKLVLGGSGNVSALSVTDQGKTVISRSNEIVPILDDFVKRHPDFSFEGAKGMINVTGYVGVLGYHTNELNAPNYEQEKAQALKVIKRLKETGWTFACHSYGHLDENAISYETFVADTNRWLREVEPLVGPTPVYVYPFGSRVPTGSPKWEYLLKSGFHVLCSVGPTTYVQWTPDSLMMDRRHIDGIALHSEQSDLKDLFDANQVIDPVRPSTY